MTRYDSEQRKVIRRIQQIGRRRGESKKEIKAALETGAVESGYRNLNHGDRDSKGWRQERQMYYKDPTNLDASINRFFDETSAKGDGRGMKSWELAQAVQRSAFPGRYREHASEAERLLRGGAGSSGRGGRSAAPQSVSSADKSELLKAYLAQRGNPSALLNLAAGIGGEQTATDAPVPTKRESSGGRSNPWKAAKAAGASVSSGHRPGAITSSGNISDHAQSEPGTMARDFTGADMGKIARAIARSLGLKNYKPGAIVNVNRGGYRYQLIYGTPDHQDHVHLGRKRL